MVRELLHRLRYRVDEIFARKFAGQLLVSFNPRYQGKTAAELHARLNGAVFLAWFRLTCAMAGNTTMPL